MALAFTFASGMLVLYMIYFAHVLRMRGRQERAKERAKGLDPLR